jgi:hypothetical protein
MIILHNAHECHNSSPRDHDRREPDGRAEFFEQEIRGDFEEAVGDEEDCGNLAFLRNECKHLIG